MRSACLNAQGITAALKQVIILMAYIYRLSNLLKHKGLHAIIYLISIAFYQYITSAKR